MRRGVFGGTFDPIHRGHLDVAAAALTGLALDDLLVMPSRVPPHRDAPRASPAHRFAMAALAIQDRAGMSVSDLELYGDGPSYTSVTLDRLASGGADLRDIYFVTGADAFRDIATWRHYPAILDRCHFVVVSRPGCAAADLPALLPALASRMRVGPAETRIPTVFLVDAPTAPISSTDVRRRVEAGEAIADLVPASVAAHIERHRLYRPRTEGHA